MKDYYKIGEISKIYGIGRDSLMYYEEIGILKPIRDTNGYRLYSITDIWKLNLIKELRVLNFPMSKIKDYLNDRSINSTQKMLNEEIRLIDEKIEVLNKQKINISKRLKAIEEVVEESYIDKIEVIHIKKRKALKLNANISRDAEVDFLVKKLQKKYEEKFYLLGNYHIGAIYNLDKLKGNIFNEYKSVFCFLEDGDEEYNLVLNEGKYITYSYRGAYSSNERHIKKLFEFIKQNNFEVINDPIEIYKIDVHETSIENEFITEIQIPIK
ncbi:MerR family transcriptional regulator [Clostridium chauvoei]|uniref:MerR family transcriptional regulator n=2 Tax=Clostridium chauvoei TaxID=46867 RepID=A0ABD4RIY0_9CLOT|nr:MerR family transcriptional regulator [Clostridium chauvoei]ATD54502.1 MerR family transcriptional regulator [Clostridium chauvoei]ATD57816.1 MerR family transcriptional regulator [Clostridium chauvoei]MBX7281050.1 MerR family transcriptional regulator [Clostridium chauvoei]MBX7283563.1 MerR family transcriptional regulator [Clostridium chauvoei]MBX7286023.1 MerR family transcriptional regulator [Clostridium chauvoei]